MPKPTPIVRIPRPPSRPAKQKGKSGQQAVISTKQTAILVQPESHLIEKGCPVTFSVVAVGNSPMEADELTYEWQFNKAPKAKPITNPASKYWFDREFFDKGFSKHPDSPNAASFTIPDVSKDDVAFYRVKVTAPGAKAAISKPAQLWVWEEVDSILVYGTVWSETGGPRGNCPGAYTKRVDYGGVWPDTSTPRKAKDQQNYGTWIEWLDYYYYSGCGQTASPAQDITVNVVNPSLPHYFTIYIPAGKATPTPYSMYLTNFH